MGKHASRKNKKRSTEKRGRERMNKKKRASGESYRKGEIIMGERHETHRLKDLLEFSLFS